jgi:vesicle transport protein SEC22
VKQVKKKLPFHQWLIKRIGIPGMSHISGELKDSAKLFKDKARDLNLQALYRKYGPPAIVILILMFVIYIRYYLF